MRSPKRNEGGKGNGQIKKIKKNDIMKRKRQKKQPKGRKEKKREKNQHGQELRGEGEIEIEEKAIND